MFTRQGHDCHVNLLREVQECGGVPACEWTTTCTHLRNEAQLLRRSKGPDVILTNMFNVMARGRHQHVTVCVRNTERRVPRHPRKARRLAPQTRSPVTIRSKPPCLEARGSGVKGGLSVRVSTIWRAVRGHSPVSGITSLGSKPCDGRLAGRRAQIRHWRRACRGVRSATKRTAATRLKQ
jgi:hypothetical protein